jgi:hypothetical protein
MALIAFEHPLSEVQMRAVIALGWKSEKAAERTLVDCALRQPRQYIPHDKREAVRRLICGKFSAALFTTHPLPIIKTFWRGNHYR